MILFKIITKSTRGKLFSFQHCVYEPLVFVLYMLAVQQSLKFSKAIRNKLFHSTMISVWKYADLLRVANLLTVSGEWKNMWSGVCPIQCFPY